MPPQRLYQRFLQGQLWSSYLRRLEWWTQPVECQCPPSVCRQPCTSDRHCWSSNLPRKEKWPQKASRRWWPPEVFDRFSHLWILFETVSLTFCKQEKVFRKRLDFNYFSVNLFRWTFLNSKGESITEFT